LSGWEKGKGRRINRSKRRRDVRNFVGKGLEVGEGGSRGIVNGGGEGEAGGGGGWEEEGGEEEGGGES